MRSVKLVFLALGISLMLFSCARQETSGTETNNTVAQNTESNTSPASPEVADELASGRSIYKESCVKCHKEDGTGGEVEIDGVKIKAHNLKNEHAKKESDKEIIEHIYNGVDGEGMPAFKDILTDEQIKDVVKYIRKELQKS